MYVCMCVLARLCVYVDIFNGLCDNDSWVAVQCFSFESINQGGDILTSLGAKR